MIKQSTLLEKLSFGQIIEINKKSRSFAKTKLNPNTRKTLMAHFGKKHSDYGLLTLAKEKFQGYLIVEDNVFFNSFVDSGAYGEYYQISKNRGVKVLNVDKKNKYRTKNALKNSFCWGKAKKEFKIQQKASKLHSFVVKPIKLIVVYNLDHDSWHPAIVMTHFCGSTMHNHRNQTFVEQLIQAFDRKLLKSKIKHGDIHPGNILYRNKTFKLIDFGRANVLK